jgi:hypothetical protein
MATADERLATLERRLQEVEDRLAIMQLIASYGPAVDGLDRDGVAAIWAEDGSYDYGGTPLEGRDGVAALIDLDTHRAYVGAGSSHVLSLPRIALDENRATVVNYSQVFIKDGASWRADRTSANRWELLKTPEGWQVLTRTNRLLDGSPAARELLQRP